MGRVAIDMAGRVCGRLRVHARAGLGRPGAMWWCECECGKRLVVAGPLLRRGAVKSCGCLKREVGAAHLRAWAAAGGHSALRHGDARAGREAPEWHAWHSIKRRCDPKASKRHPDYAGRGISVCERWRGSYEAFLSDVGRRPSDLHSLDRWPNNDGNYEPGNVRWATRNEQARNRRNNRFIECDGHRKTLAEWAEITGLKNTTIRARIRAGWSIGEALRA